MLSVPRDIAASMRASTADIRATLALLSSITLFAAAFLVLNATAMTVVERIRELGLLRAAGATRWQLVRVVETQALLLGPRARSCGVVLGLGARRARDGAGSGRPATSRSTGPASAGASSLPASRSASA